MSKTWAAPPAGRKAGRRCEKTQPHWAGAHLQVCVFNNFADLKVCASRNFSQRLTPWAILYRPSGPEMPSTRTVKCRKLARLHRLRKKLDSHSVLKGLGSSEPLGPLELPFRAARSCACAARTSEESAVFAIFPQPVSAAPKVRPKDPALAGILGLHNF